MYVEVSYELSQISAKYNLSEMEKQNKPVHVFMFGTDEH